MKKENYLAEERHSDLYIKENKYLDKVLTYLREREAFLEQNQDTLFEESQRLKEEAWDEHLEFADFNTNAQFDSAVIQNALQESHNRAILEQKELKTIKNIILKPYFAHLSFRFHDVEWEDAPEEAEVEELYIGYHDILNYNAMEQYVIDWRAPIANIYYDSDNIGPASYLNEGTMVSGDLLAKYQIEIIQSTLQRVINTSEEIYDEILQMVLSSVSSARMQEIVQTLQKEQNTIVRAEPNRNLIVQGVAGSGKSSIALHRAAYLMYVHKDILSDNILLITPSESFASYISDVLPNLGEENVRYMTAERVLREELAEVEGRYLNYTFESCTTYKRNLLSTFAWVEWVEEFAMFLGNNCFQAQTIESKFFKIPAKLLQQLYATNYRHIPPFRRKEYVFEHIQDFIESKEDYAEARTEIARKLDAMYLVSNVRQAYEVFVRWVVEEKEVPQDFFNLEQLDMADMYILTLLKVLLYGASDNQWVRHLIVDEMQDLSALEHEILRRIFVCPRTLLGDINQAIQFPLEVDYLCKLKNLYKDDPIRTESFTLSTSYRSTKQITEFSRSILEDDSIQALHRDGADVIVEEFAENREMEHIESMWKKLLEWKEKSYRTALIVAKDEKTVHYYRTAIRERIAQAGEKILVNDYLQWEEQFAVTICTVTQSKGVEFDGVIVANASSTQYKEDLDRTRLYVACTRALHDLYITVVGERSSFLPVRI